MKDAARTYVLKEPIAAEYDLLRADHVLFSYLHLAAVPELARALHRECRTLERKLDELFSRESAEK